MIKPPLLLVLVLAISGAVGQRKDSSGGPEVIPVTHGQFREILKNDSGMVVLVNAWATWCKPCTDEMPGVLSIGRKYREKRFALVLLSADDPDSIDLRVKPFLRKIGVHFTTYLMSDSTDDAFITAMSPKWSGALPASFFYRPDGSLARMLVGERTAEQLKREVDSLFPGGG